MKLIQEMLNLTEETKTPPINLSPKLVDKILQYALQNYAQSKLDAYLGGDNWPRGNFNAEKILEKITGKSVKELEMLGEEAYKALADKHYKKTLASKNNN